MYIQIYRGWGRVYIDCWSSLYIVGEPAPTTFNRQICYNLQQLITNPANARTIMSRGFAIV